MLDKDLVFSIFAEKEKALLRFAYFMLHDQELAKDFVQDVFIKLLHQEEMPDNVNAWLYRVCRNLIIDFKRRQKKVSFVDEYTVFTPTVSSRDHLELSEDFKRLHVAMEYLTELEKVIVILKFYEDKSYKEISLITDKSVSNVGFILHQAMKKLREKMKVKEEE